LGFYGKTADVGNSKSWDLGFSEDFWDKTAGSEFICRSSGFSTNSPEKRWLTQSSWQTVEGMQTADTFKQTGAFRIW
jgi:hypothetical protein